MIPDLIKSRWMGILMWVHLEFTRRGSCDTICLEAQRNDPDVECVTSYPLAVTDLNHNVVYLGADLLSIYDGQHYLHFFVNVSRGGYLAQIGIQEYDNLLALDVLTLRDVSGSDISMMLSNIPTVDTFQLLFRRPKIRFETICDYTDNMGCCFAIMNLPAPSFIYKYLRFGLQPPYPMGESGISPTQFVPMNALYVHVFDSRTVPGSAKMLSYTARRVMVYSATVLLVDACRDGTTITTCCSTSQTWWFWQVPVYEFESSTMTLFYRTYRGSLYIGASDNTSSNPIPTRLGALSPERCRSFQYHPRAVVPSAHMLALESAALPGHFLQLKPCPTQPGVVLEYHSTSLHTPMEAPQLHVLLEDFDDKDEVGLTVRSICYQTHMSDSPELTPGPVKFSIERPPTDGSSAFEIVTIKHLLAMTIVIIESCYF